MSVRKRQDAGEATPVGVGEAVAADPDTASATKTGPAFSGHAQAPARQTRPPAEQSVAGCQVRHEDPATTGRQRRIWVAAGVAGGRVEDGAGASRGAGAGRAGSGGRAGRSRVGAWRGRRLVPAAERVRPVLRAGHDLAPGVAEGRGRRAARGRGALARGFAPVRRAGLVGRAIDGDRAAGADPGGGRAGDELARRAGGPGTDCPASVWPGQESASVLQRPFAPQPWSEGHSRSVVHGAPVVVTVQAAARSARKAISGSPASGPESTRIARSGDPGRAPSGGPPRVDSGGGFVVSSGAMRTSVSPSSPPALLAVRPRRPRTRRRPHPFDVHDLVTLRASPTRASPDGKQVAYVLRTTDLEANQGRTDLWLVGADGTGLRQLTTSPESESSPRWAPDGKALYFLSARGGPQQVWRLRARRRRGGAGHRAAARRRRLPALARRHAARRLARASSPTAPTPPRGLACTTKRLDERARRRRRPAGSTPALRAPLGRVARRPPLPPLRGARSAGGDAGRPDEGHGRRRPDQALRRRRGVHLHPRRQGRGLHRQGRRPRGGLVHQLRPLVVPADGSAAPRNLTATTRPGTRQPVFSPDGKTLA